MDAGAGNELLPVAEILVLLGKASEGAPVDRVVLGIIDPSFNPLLVPGFGGAGGKDAGAVVMGDLLNPGVQSGA